MRRLSGFRRTVAPAWQRARALDQFALVYLALTVVQLLALALYEAGLLGGHLSVVLGVATSLGGPVLSFLASAHVVLHRRVSNRRSVAAVGLPYFTTCLSFAILYAIIANNDPHAFTVPQAAPLFDLGAALYFSFTTITTTGFGDIAPLSGFARVVVCWEIVTGLLFQVFIFSVVASLFLPASKP